jgi:hypothetical protein
MSQSMIALLLPLLAACSCVRGRPQVANSGSGASDLAVAAPCPACAGRHLQERTAEVRGKSPTLIVGSICDNVHSGVLTQQPLYCNNRPQCLGLIDACSQLVKRKRWQARPWLLCQGYLGIDGVACAVVVQCRRPSNCMHSGQQ